MLRLHKLFRYSPSKFTVLLGFLISQIFLTPIAGKSIFLQQILYFYTYLVLLSAVAAIVENKVKLSIFIAFYIASFISSVLFFKMHSIHWLAISEASDMMMIAITVWGILIFMRRQKKVTSDLISGAICVYMLCGLLWANGYSLCMIYDRSAISGISLSESIFAVRNLMVYFSYITMMTIGYGDMLPVTSMARSLVMLQGLFGQMYLAVFVAGVIGMFLAQRDEDKIIEKIEEDAKLRRY
ncbi:potassium channel family protein [Desulfovibrio gilichinskyi]|uniref:Ion channel n=1 Tax=Desulfovibrio gilichinskyi TaxID=1519643 RepID=A0A1X7CTZ6_9BACT|nr:potassium channel family protein [Desulfovibrio gilichinskyi]SMF02600.1 Ion channel [Desulfovibrio gilichinskyi]